MNRYMFLPVCRWSYQPTTFEGALDKLKQAQAIGHSCESCGKILIEKIVINDGQRFHQDCYLNTERNAYEDFINR